MSGLWYTYGFVRRTNVYWDPVGTEHHGGLPHGVPKFCVHPSPRDSRIETETISMETRIKWGSRQWCAGTHAWCSPDPATFSRIFQPVCQDSNCPNCLWWEYFHHGSWQTSQTRAFVLHSPRRCHRLSLVPWLASNSQDSFSHCAMLPPTSCQGGREKSLPVHWKAPSRITMNAPL